MKAEAGAGAAKDSARSEAPAIAASALLENERVMFETPSSLQRGSDLNTLDVNAP